MSSYVSAAGASSSLKGRILLNVEGKGEAWYVNPRDAKRYYLGRPNDAFSIMRSLSVGITNSKLARIETADRDKLILNKTASVADQAVASSSVAGASSTPQNPGASAGKPSVAQFVSFEKAKDYDRTLSKSVAGQILLQVENNGEAWYVSPVNLKKYYLGRPADAFRVMREHGLGITRKNLALIHKNGSSESINEWSKYEHKKIKAVSGDFTVDMIEIDLRNPKLKIITTASEPSPKKDSDKQKGKFGSSALFEFRFRQ